MIACVLIEYNVKKLDKTFEYIVPVFLEKIIKVGNKVHVPFGKCEVEGFVLSISQQKDNNIDYKEIIDIVNLDFYLNEELLELGKYISKITLSNLISCYQIMLPKALKASLKTTINKKYETYIKLNNYNNKLTPKEGLFISQLKEKGKILKKDCSTYMVNKLLKKNVIVEEKQEINREVVYSEEKKDIVLTSYQTNVVDSIYNDIDNNIFLIRGVTASGKTEVYISLIQKYLKKGKTSIMLVPEISLTPQIVSRFKAVFGSKVAVLHSRLSEGEKYDEYRKIMKGEVAVVIGARSAVFAPLNNIGLIVVDECQSSTYKQENNPKYNAIDIAFKRCEYHKCKCILGSATPLLEQYARGKKGVFKLIEMDKKVYGRLPKITLVDMSEEIKKRNFIISNILRKKIKETIDLNQQVLLLLNRRGFSTFISCSSCGYVFKCPNCDISLTYHKSSSSFSCHYCGYKTRMTSNCPQCKEDAIKDLGLGTEKLEEIIKKEFNNYRIIRMDADTTSRKGSYEKIINSFKNHEYDIIIGTQMISKGLNFPNLSLVGIINSDTSLNIPDFRSAERTFELLSQTSGRVGRYELPGEVIIQTYNPDNYVYECIKYDDYIKLYNKEMLIRKKLKYPPYYYIICIKIISNIYEVSRDESNKVKKYLEKNLSDDYIILGPSIGRILRVNNKYNFQIIIKYKSLGNINDVLKSLKDNYINSNCQIDIDLNPINNI